MSLSKFYCNYTIGEDAYLEIPAVCAGYGKKIFVIGGKTALSKALGKLMEALEGSGLEIAGVEEYGEECTRERMRELAEIGRSLNAEMVFGVGGGKALDTAKGAASMMDGCPVFTFPTIAATCAPTSALSVCYLPDHTFEQFLYFPRPAVHCFIDTRIIAEAPVQYLRAGIGDTLAKHFECEMSSRGIELGHQNGLAVAMSSMCWEPLLKYGAQALRECELHQCGGALEETVCCIIVTTGLVSLFVDDQYNGAVAHSVCYALGDIPGFEARVAHGEAVAYGLLVQLAMEQKTAELEKIRAFLREVHLYTTLKEMGVEPSPERYRFLAEHTLPKSDMEVLPYRVTEEMLEKAFAAVEQAG